VSSLIYLSGADVEALALSDEEILSAVRDVLAQQGRGETVVEPRTHLFPRRANGHFNVLRGVTAQHAGVKVVGDFVDNHRLGLPSELALLLLGSRDGNARGDRRRHRDHRDAYRRGDGDRS
jgi:ornithine cyclodeaminase